MSKEYIYREEILKAIDEILFKTDRKSEKQIGVLKCRAAIREMEAADVVEKENFIKQINFAIKATDGKDGYSVGLRNGLRFALSLNDVKELKYERMDGRHACHPLDSNTGTAERRIKKW